MISSSNQTKLKAANYLMNSAPKERDLKTTTNSLFYFLNLKYCYLHVKTEEMLNGELVPRITNRMTNI